MSGLDDIRNSFKQLEDSREKISQLRRKWSVGLKPQLWMRLEFVANTILRQGWYAWKQEEETNHDSLFLVMPKQPTGIHDSVTNRGYEQEEGYLQFAQLLNGYIRVSVKYPHVEGITVHKAAEQIEILSPEDFNEIRIDSFINQFLMKMNAWYRDEGIKAEPIGFKSS